jgi:hypothetical protein
MEIFFDRIEECRERRVGLSEDPDFDEMAAQLVDDGDLRLRIPRKSPPRTDMMSPPVPT